MKKLLFSFILMAMGVGMANAAEPDEGILCSYPGHVAFFPLSESPSVEYVDKEDEPNAVVLVGGTEKLSVALIDGGTLEVSYESRTLSEYTVNAKITANSQSETSDNQVVKAAEGQDGDVIITLPAASVGDYEMAEQTVKVKFDAEGNISMVDGQTIDFTGTQDVVVTITSVTGTVADGKLNVTLEGEGSNGVGFTFVYGTSTTPTHQHNYATTWSYDENNHWHACNGSVGSCDATRSGEAAHSYGNVTTETSYYTCSVCQYVNTTRQATYNDQAAATNVTNMINSIGTVTLESKNAIDAARTAYDNLTATQQALVTNLQTLVDAEAEYARLKAIDDVEKTIDAIGVVEPTDECKALIDAAREAYDALPEADKEEVENYQTLLNAEEAYLDFFMLYDQLELTAFDGNSYYATFSSRKPVFVEFKANVLTVKVDGTKLKLDTSTFFGKDVKEEVEDGYIVNGTWVPANTGVLLKSYTNNVRIWTYGNKKVNKINNVNFLRPAAEEMQKGYKFYMLAYGDEDLTPHTLGFYYGAEDGAPFEARQGSAYLAVPENVEAKGFCFADDATAIQNVDAEDGANAVYNLQGQRVKSSQKGIVIVNGKKIINK